MKIKQQIINKQELDELIANKIIKFYEDRRKEGKVENKCKKIKRKENERKSKKTKRRGEVEIKKTQKKVLKRKKRI